MRIQVTAPTTCTMISPIKEIACYKNMLVARPYDTYRRLYTNRILRLAILTKNKIHVLCVEEIVISKMLLKCWHKFFILPECRNVYKIFKKIIKNFDNIQIYCKNCWHRFWIYPEIYVKQKYIYFLS